MFKVYIRRDCEVRAPYDVCVENYCDWTHFSHVHRRSHPVYLRLFSDGRRDVFLYKAKRVQFLPGTVDYIVFRQMTPDKEGYDHAYLNVKTGQTHFLKARIVKNESRGTVSMIGEFVFFLPDYWRLFPRLFLAIFRWRMRKVMREDNDVIREQLEMGGLKSSAACAPSFPPLFERWSELFQEGRLPDADARFDDHVYEAFEGVKR